MKNLPSIKRVCYALLFIVVIEFFLLRIENLTILSLDSSLISTGNSFIESVALHKNNETRESVIAFDEEVMKQEIEIASLQASTPVIVYEGMTEQELGSKLNKVLGSSLDGYGDVFAKYSIEYGVDPYLATAITLLETGCKWGCSTLVKQCNNVGGMKGSGCGSYQAFDTLEDGIESMIRNLANNYIAKGLTTPEEMNKKYAASSTWATKVNNYINEIRNA